MQHGKRLSFHVLALALSVGLGACTAKSEPPDGTGTGGTPGGGGSGGSRTGGTTATGGSGTGGTGTGGSSVGVDAPVDRPVDGGDAAAPRVQLRINWWGGAPRRERTLKVIELFRAKHPDIGFIVDEAAPIASTAYWVKLEGQAAANDLPDIMQHDHKYLSAWANRGDIIALDPYVTDKTIDLADVPSELSDGGRIAGKLVALSLGTNTQGVILDLDAFTKAGVAVPADTWTWDDFNKTVLDLKTKGMAPLQWGYGLSIASDGIWKGLFLSEGAWVFNPDNNGIGYADDKPLVDHFTMAVALHKAMAITPRELQKRPKDMGGYGDSTAVADYPMNTGKAAMEFTSGTNLLVDTWSAGAMVAGLGERNFKALPLPRRVGKGPSVYVKPSQYLAITKKSQHPKEAAMFLDFFTNSVEANEVLLAERGVPIAKKVAAAVKAKLDLTKPGDKGTAASIDIMERVAMSGVRALPQPDPAVYSQITKAYNDVALDPLLIAGTIEPAAAAAAFRAKINEIFSGTGPDGGVDGGADGGVDGATDASSDGAIDGGFDKTVLLVVGAVPLTGNDVVVQTEIAKKANVMPVIDTESTTAMATGKAAVFITATASQAGAAAKFNEVPVPVVVMEPNIYDDMRFTAAPEEAHDTVAAQTQLTIVAPDQHPLAAGLTGNVTVYEPAFRMVFGVPAAGAVKIASVLGVAAQSAIFAYPKDAAMVTGTAPAKRVGFFLHNNATANVTADGIKLLAAAVTWVLAP